MGALRQGTQLSWRTRELARMAGVFVRSASFKRLTKEPSLHSVCPRDDSPDTTGLDDLYAAGLGPLLSLDNLELDLRALLEDGAAQVVGVDKDVLLAIIRLAMNETRLEGFPALRFMGFGKTAASRAASRGDRVAAEWPSATATMSAAPWNTYGLVEVTVTLPAQATPPAKGSGAAKTRATPG